LYPKRVYFTTSNCVFNFNFLAPVVSEIIWGSQICIKGPYAPRTPPSGKILTHFIPQVLAYTHITVKFQLHSSINVRLTESSVYNRRCIKRYPKMGVWGDLGVGANIFGGKVHPSLELHVFRHLSSRSDALCSCILYGYSHLP